MGPNPPNPRRVEPAWLLATLTVGALLGGLPAGFEPVGADPDRMYRPLKAELSRALEEGRLPFWSDRFGVGAPLVAESHVAAFYPPNLVVYRFLGVSTAFRWSMWLHMLALAAATYAYGRRLGLTPWGSALAALAFSLCGFQAVHAAHEPFYHLMPYLPLSLLLAEVYLGSGRPVWLAALALAVGAQWTLGHFQIQMWTNALVVLTGLWRVAVDRRPWRRLAGLVAALAWGAAVAAVQLGLSWDLARAVGHTARPFRDLAYYSYPPAHWVEPALPWFFRGLPLGGDDPYFHRQGTSAFEATFYVGTVPLVLAFVGALGRRRGGGATGPWKLLVPLSFALATMPRWWPAGYAAVLTVPGLGYFRAPARYTLLTSLGLALLAGQGLDRAASARRFRAGVSLAVAFGLAAVGYGFVLAGRRGFRPAGGPFGLPFGVATALLTWAAGLAVLAAWRAGRVGGWLPAVATAVELGALYFLGPIAWGRAVPLPGSSPVLSSLAAGSGVGRVGGVLDNLPVSAGMATGSPYLGMALSPINQLLRDAQERDAPHGPAALLWLRRLGVTHSVWDVPVSFGPAAGRGPARSDSALDLLAYRPAGAPARRPWSVVRHPDPFPPARVALRAMVAPDRRTLVGELSAREARDEVWYEAADAPRRGLTASAGSARVVGWDGRTGVVGHDGPCELVLTRAYDAGWRARVGDRPEGPVYPVDGGLQSVRVGGSGETRVSVRFEPPLFRASAAVSAVATTAALVVIAAPLARRRRPTGGDHGPES